MNTTISKYIIPTLIIFSSCTQLEEPNNSQNSEYLKEVMDQTIFGYWVSTKIQYNENGGWQTDDSAIFEIYNNGSLRVKSLEFYEAIYGPGLQNNFYGQWKFNSGALTVYKKKAEQYVESDLSISFDFINTDEVIFSFPYKDSSVTTYCTRISDFRKADTALLNTSSTNYVGAQDLHSYWHTVTPVYDKYGQISKLNELFIVFYNYYQFIYTNTTYTVLRSFTSSDDITNYTSVIEFLDKYYEVKKENQSTQQTFCYMLKDNTIKCSPSSHVDISDYQYVCTENLLTFSTKSNQEYTFEKLTYMNENKYPWE